MTFERTNVKVPGTHPHLNPDKVVLFKDSFVVVPDENDRGFYVLSLSVQDRTRSKHVGIFEAVTESFRPGR